MTHIKITPAELREAADTLEQQARIIDERVADTGRIIDRAIAGQAFAGNRATALINRYHQKQQAMEAWPQSLNAFAAKLREAADRFESADRIQPNEFNRPLTAHQKSMLDTWRKLEQSEIDFIRELEAQLSGGNYLLNLAAGTVDDYKRMLKEARDRLADLQNKINDLTGPPTLMSDQGYYGIARQRYKDSDLLDQGLYGTCTAHAVFNSLIMRGYKISDAEAHDIIVGLEAMGKRDIGDRFLGIPLDALGFKVDNPQGGFDPADVAVNLFENYGLNPVESSFSNPTDPTQTQQAVQGLIAQVQAGEPVYVVTTCEFVNQPKSAHAMNVVGVQLDDHGNLGQVRVATNWGEPPYKNIPAEVFMRDWGRANYYSIQV